MKRMNNKGVTMMLLVVTIILMILIAFLAVFYSQDITPEARISAAYSSLKAVKDACISAEGFSIVGKDEYYFFGKNIHSEHSPAEVDEYAKNCGLSSADDFGERTYLLDPNSEKESDRRRIQNLEISNITGTYIVDLDNDKYYVVGGVYRQQGEKKYEYKDIQTMYHLLTSAGKDE